MVFNWKLLKRMGFNPVYVFIQPLRNEQDTTQGQILNRFDGGALGVMDIVTGNGHGDQISNPRRDCFDFTYR